MPVDLGGGLLSALGRRVEDWRDDAEDRGRRTGRDLAEAGDEAWRRGGEAASRLRRQGRDAAHGLGRRGEEAKEELRRLWSDIGDLLDREVAPRAAEYGHTARRYASEGRDRAVEAAGLVRDTARARPLLTIGVAIAATWLVASLMKRPDRT